MRAALTKSLPPAILMMMKIKLLVKIYVVSTVAFLSLWIFGTILTGCKSPPDRIAYNTIGSLDTVAKTTYSGYLSSVLHGLARTNEVPEISLRYNQVEGGLLLTATISSEGTNSIAPQDLVSNVVSFVTYVGTLTAK